MDINVNNIIEFSKIYKRVMEIELRLKHNLLTSLLSTFQDKAFYRLIPFLKTKFVGKYFTKKGKTYYDFIDNLISSNQSDKDKLNSFISRAYLSDILQIITEYKTVYKDKKFNHYFYKQSVNFNDLKKFASGLTALRNCIMHFNFFQYNANKILFIKSLSFWETLLLCRNSFMHKLKPIKPTLKNILLILRDKYPDIFNNNDRVLCDIFDDIAILNGMSVENLPQYWSIGRCRYNLRKNYK